MKVEIAPASDAEREWAAQLMSHIDPWKRIGFSIEAARKVMSRIGTELYIAHYRNEPIGFALLNPHGLASAPYVNSLAVAPEFQNRAAGTAMLHFAEQHYAHRRFLYLCVSSFNAGARRLYERLGYQFVAELKDHAANGHSEVLMRKALPRKRPKLFEGKSPHAV